MRISCCKLKRKAQRELLEFFVMAATARSAANIIHLQANTVALFDRKIRQLIINMSEIVHKNDNSKLMEVILVAFVKAREGVMLRGKCLFLVFLKEEEKFTHKWS